MQRVLVAAGMAAALYGVALSLAHAQPKVTTTGETGTSVALNPATQANRDRAALTKAALPARTAAKTPAKPAEKKPLKKPVTKKPPLAASPKMPLAIAGATSATTAPIAVLEPKPAPAQRNNPDEALALGRNLEQAGKRREALIAYERAATAGNGPASGSAAKRLGELYDTGGDGVPRDYETALRWYEKARSAGEVIAKPGVYRTVR